MSNPLELRLQTALHKRAHDGNLRQLSLSMGIDFFSNDYLGLAKNSSVLQPFLEEEYAHSGTQQWHGATGSRLLSGNSEYVMQAEKWLAALFQAESALIFNSGYAANLSVLSAIPQKGDTILYDEKIHASLKEGARLSFAQRYSFAHNDLTDLEQKLQRTDKGLVFVVIETVYSMDGDIAPLEAIIAICKKYGAYLIVDEAHSTGLWGNGGSGLLCEKDLAQDVFARIYTFGKAMGGHGACVAGSQTLTNYLVNFARPFIYTTAMPLQNVAYLMAAFQYLAENEWLAKQLHSRVSCFRQQVKAHRLQENFVESTSPIQMLKVQGNEYAQQMARDLRAQHYNLRPVLSPTVPAGQERIRICLHSDNSEQEIAELIAAIAKMIAH
jgi:8-amino-7-oxononanoate synthase